jgi:DNA-binding NarL/FixJ family response regulator
MVIRLSEDFMAQLTQREQLTIIGLSQGLSHQAIAENLNISVATVGRCCSNIRKKYNTTSMATAVGAAFLTGDMKDTQVIAQTTMAFTLKAG